MARRSRFRSRDTTYRGTKLYFATPDATGNPISSQPISISDTSTCGDSVGYPVTNSSFNSTQYRGCFRVNGVIVSGGGSVEFKDVPAFGYTLESLQTVPLSAPSGWALDVVAGTNPSRPTLAPPTMIQDLLSLPRMIKEVGDILRKPKKALSVRSAADIHLALRFGWLPLIEDLHKLLDLQNLILKRNKELNGLYSSGGKGQRRRIRFSNDTQTAQGFIDSAGNGSGVANTRISITVARECWGTIRWFPNTPPPYHPDDVSQNAFTTRLLLGATPEGLAKGLWDVIPWTWLLGWFNNVGKYTLAYSNSVPASHSSVSLMSQVLISYSPGSTSYTNATGSVKVGGGRVKTIKTRGSSGSITPGFRMPYLDMSKLSILGSLAIQRFPKRW